MKPILVGTTIWDYNWELWVNKEIFVVRIKCFKSQHVWMNFFQLAIFVWSWCIKAIGFELQFLAICSGLDQWLLMPTQISKSVNRNWVHSENRYLRCSKYLSFNFLLAFRHEKSHEFKNVFTCMKKDLGFQESFPVYSLWHWTYFASIQSLLQNRGPFSSRLFHKQNIVGSDSRWMTPMPSFISFETSLIQVLWCYTPIYLCHIFRPQQPFLKL